MSHLIKNPNALVLISAEFVGDPPQINTEEDVSRVAQELLPIVMPSMAKVYSKLLAKGILRAEPTWDSTGRILEISLVRVPQEE